MANVCEIYNCDAVDFEENEDDDSVIDELFEAYRQQSNEYSPDEPSPRCSKAVSHNPVGSVDTTPKALSLSKAAETEPRTPKGRGRPRRQLADFLLTTTPISAPNESHLDRRHVCDVCGKRFKMKIHLTDHKLIHSGEKPHKCPICGRAFRQKSQLNGHVARHTNDKPKHTCTLCDATFRLKKEYDQHARSHVRTDRGRVPAVPTPKVDPDAAECEFEEEITVFGLKMNSKSDQTATKVEKDSLRLDTTMSRGETASAIVSKTEHAAGEEKNTADQYSASPHSQASGSPPREQAQRSVSETVATPSHGPIKIKQEKLSPTATWELAKTVDELKPYQCEFCFKNFRLRNHLTEHRLIHLNLKPHKCPNCEKSFRQKSHLTSHLMKICGKQNRAKYVCNLCPKSFRFKTALDIHTMGHSNDGQLNDDNTEPTKKGEEVQVKKENQLDNSSGFYSEAEVSSTREGNVEPAGMDESLTESTRVDIEPSVTPWSLAKTGDRRYQCDTCSKRFRSYTHLRDHLLVHAGIKPHKCMVCLRSFRQKSCLKSHMSKIHTNKTTYKCDTCGASYLVRVHYLRHVQKCSDESAKGDDSLDGGLDDDLRKLWEMANAGGLGSPTADNDKNDSQPIGDSDFEDMHGFDSDTDRGVNDDTCNSGEDKSADCTKDKKPSYDSETDMDSLTARVSENSTDQFQPLPASNCQLSPQNLSLHLGNGGDGLVESEVNPVQTEATEKLRKHRKPRGSYVEVSDPEISDPENMVLESVESDSNLEHKAGVKKFVCHLCDKRFSHKRQLDDHTIAQHTDKRPYACAECATSYTSLRNLECHVREKHPDSKRDCPHCKQVFKTVWSLNKHACPYRKWVCSVCNDVFANEAELAEHSTSHADVEHFTCLLCDKQFLSDSGLKVHITQVHCGVSAHVCEICEKSFASDALLRLHVRRAHTAKPVLSCNWCHKTFKSKYVLKVHERYHTNERNHQCPHCEKRFVKSSDLNSHILTHSARRFACEYCGSMFRTNGALKTHTQTKHPADPDKFKCKVCGATFGRECLLQSHSRIHDENRELYSCDYCLKKFTDKYYVKQHMRYHTNERNYVCHQCGKGFIRKCDLTAHLPKHSDARPYVCADCGKAFKKEICLREHAITHNPDRHFKCAICDETFPTRAKLKTHSYTHSGEKPKYSCELCPKTFVSKSYVKLHMLRHNNIRNFECHECGKCFVRKCDLDSHMYKHTKLRPYTCEYCGNTYRSKYSLAQHQMLHTGDMPYSCDVCHKKFRKEEYLRLHSAMHTGDKPYMCEICSKSFARSSSLFKHRVIHDDVKPHNCPICKKGFTQKQLFDVHMKIHAGIKDHVCRLCGHAFAAKSGLRNHYQYVHSNHKPHKCEYCEKCFAFKTDRRKHMKVHLKDDGSHPVMRVPLQGLSDKSDLMVDGREAISRDVLDKSDVVLNEMGTEYMTSPETMRSHEFMSSRENFSRSYPEAALATEFLRNVPMV